MDEKRKGEIALAIQRYRLGQGKSARYFGPGTDFPTELKRLIEDVALGTGIPKEELIEFTTSLIKEVEVES